MASSLRAYLEPIASWFAQFGLPEPITHWGHPAMMGIVIFAMGSSAAIAGWKIRTGEPDATMASMPVRKFHKKVALWMTTFIGMGYTGGLLSLVMQDQPILESPHFWTGSAVLALLGLNGAISMSKFAGGKDSLRTVHAYIGTAALALMFFHAALGLKLGLSI
ncbi:DUF4079 domain-containing protein [Leptothoe sp. PORK10 BA2]|uniref:DUF4079 domain-containing protein n=1 Tax=Leptothoe sp. PORK10 BA2 TaxID=3110254 RepID=UPI002B2176B4|nr:DUF4079 domain-containing protein [Leptothoe sp. PORK10 BA2]MEA5466545.1 DUF4079 domain-containing protein [Leptothoe sp. PORK10 BA2]